MKETYRPFSNESAERKRGLESDSEKETNQHVRLYFDMQSASAGNPELKMRFGEAEQAVIRYARSIMQHAHSSIEENRRNEIVVAEQYRSAMREALSDALNILSRACERWNVDNTWRRRIGEEQRDIGAWGISVADHMRRGALEAYELPA